MNSKDIEALLERYQQGTCTAEEKLRVEQWFDEQAATTDWDWAADEMENTEQEIKNRINFEIDAPPRTMYAWLKPLIAAAAAIIIITTFYFRDALYDKVVPLDYVVLETPLNKQLKITLSDGSAVWLNAQSKIKYPRKFGHSIREVFLLEGEAYFDVQHDKSKPFLVSSGNITTHVLGTAFNVRNFAWLNEVQITVLRGKVGVQASAGKTEGNKTNFLTPNQQLTIRRTTGQLLNTNVDAANVIGWQQGRLVFNNETFSNVAKVLEHKYKIDIHFKDSSLENERLTGAFENSDGLQNIVFLLARANNVAYQFKNNHLFFSKK